MSRFFRRSRARHNPRLRLTFALILAGLDFVFVTGALAAVAALGGSPGPRGTIAIVDDRTIYLIPAAGGRVRRVTAPDRALGRVDLSPDGFRIALDGFKGIWVMRRDGSRAELLQTPVTTRSPGDVAWSPNGQKLAFSGGDSLLTIFANGRGSRQLTTAREFDIAYPDWTPDSRRIVFARKPAASSEREWVIYSIGADGVGLRRIIRGVDPTVSPDGSTLAFSRLARPGFGGGVYVVPIGGGRARLLFPGGSNPEWSPDGRYLAYTRDVACGHAVCEGRVFVAPAAGDKARAYGPRIADIGALSWSR